MTENKKATAIREDDCDACPLVTDRREFLRGASALALAALSLALPIRSATATVLNTAIGNRKKVLSYPVPAADGVDIDHDNDIILVRYQGSVYAFALSCPHQNTALRWNDGNARFQCPKHHSQYTPDGVFITGRATRNMDRLMIRRDANNSIVVDPDTFYQSDDNPNEWKSAFIKL
ncbi:MAG TPA: Rieske 2Fe-2S domain-containing protein [Gemmatimonadaceae bacterium]|nr:Rieske 2Fe-2S domain-containing protein [Gemmatimonadaceae bacterium]